MDAEQRLEVEKEKEKKEEIERHTEFLNYLMHELEAFKYKAECGWYGSCHYEITSKIEDYVKYIKKHLNNDFIDYDVVN